MPRGQLDGYEEAAGQIVAQQLGGAHDPRDVPGAADGTHDADIELDDGSRIALEVTSAADGALEALRSAALGREWKAPTLGHHWWLGLPNKADVKVKALMTGVVPHLEVLERHDVEQVASSGHPDRGLPADADLEAVTAAQGVFGLGAHRATRLGVPKQGETALVMASLSGAAGSNFDLLNELVAECAEAKVDKLLAAAGDERHLFIWMRPSVSDAELAMATLPPPPEVPVLPDGIDTVWVATGPTAPDSLFGRLWQLRPPGSWEVIEPVPNQSGSLSD